MKLFTKQILLLITGFIITLVIIPVTIVLLELKKNIIIDNYTSGIIITLIWIYIWYKIYTIKVKKK